MYTFMQTADRNQLDELVTIDPRAEREAANRDFTLEGKPGSFSPRL